MGKAMGMGIGRDQGSEQTTHENIIRLSDYVDRHGRQSKHVAYLLSSPRAGSTLVSRVLDSHSEIASPCEICVPFVVARCWKFYKSLRNISKISKYFGAELPRPLLRLAFRKSAIRHLDGLTQQVLKKDNKKTLVIKDPRHVAHLDRLVRLYSGEPPKFILLHRDARAVCHSFNETLGREPERGFRVWLEGTRGMLECERRFPDRCLAMRFEDFVSNPAASAVRLTQFLGHRFEPSMLDYGSHDHADNHLGLWTNPRLVSSIERRAIVPGKSASWAGNEAVLNLYKQRQDVQMLNRQLGYDSTTITREAA